MEHWLPRDEGSNDRLMFWWHAHTVDALLDGYIRTRDSRYLALIESNVAGAKVQNGGNLLNNFYDDMEWWALALLRVFDVTQKEQWLEEVSRLWADIQTAWNDHMGGGMAWKKDQLDYKNTPANAPAAILAARLYQRFHREEDLAWALKIYQWNKDHLVDPATGFVWDGMNRNGDGRIDYDWTFTYCQGVFLGAGVELYRAVSDSTYLDDALRTTQGSLNKLLDDRGMLPEEGMDDCGLFNGIYVRYLKLLRDLTPVGRIDEVLTHNAESLWTQVYEPGNGLMGPSWTTPATDKVQLSSQLSGIMLFEAVASLD